MSELVTIFRKSQINRFSMLGLRLPLLRVTPRFLVLEEPNFRDAYAQAHIFGFRLPFGGVAYFDRASGKGVRSPKGGRRGPHPSPPRKGGDWSDWQLEQAAWDRWSVEGPERESRLQGSGGLR